MIMYLYVIFSVTCPDLECMLKDAMILWSPAFVIIAAFDGSFSFKIVYYLHSASLTPVCA